MYGKFIFTNENTKIINVNYHEYIKIHKRLNMILDKKIIELNDLRPFDIDNIANIIETELQRTGIELDKSTYTNFALSFTSDGKPKPPFKLAKIYLYKSFSYYDICNIDYVFEDIISSDTTSETK
jgi:hypothetical protein